MEASEIMQLVDIETKSYKAVKAKDFEDMICARLEKHGKVYRQVRVADRGDGMSGYIDLVFSFNGQNIPIEIDNVYPRKKSIFKIKLYNKKNAFVILRSPYKIIKIL